MFGWKKDSRTARLEQCIDLVGKGDKEVQTDVLIRLKNAALQLCEPFEDISTFADLKFALRPDQADLIADKAVDLQAVVQGHELGNPVDEMVFFFCEASLRHRAGHKWVPERAARLIDNMICTAETVGTGQQ